MRTSHILLLVTLAGCTAGASAEDAAVDGTIDEGVAAAGGSFEGTYEVPVTDTSLAAAATYDVDVKFQRRADGSYRLHYDLPTTLVGGTQKVDLRGAVTGSTFDLTGTMGTASCEQTGADVVCNERFPGMTVDAAGVATALAAEGITGADATAKLAVSARFGIDPIGILRFKRTGSGRGRGGRD